MIAGELIERIRRRGGDFRLAGERFQYRPAGVLTDDELGWVLGHRDDIARALAGDDGADKLFVSGLAAGLPLGEAGPGVKVWHCSVAVSSVHARRERADGCVYCATCHPPAVAGPRY